MAGRKISPTEFVEISGLYALIVGLILASPSYFPPPSSYYVIGWVTLGLTLVSALSLGFIPLKFLDRFGRRWNLGVGLLEVIAVCFPLGCLCILDSVSLIQEVNDPASLSGFQLSNWMTEGLPPVLAYSFFAIYTFVLVAYLGPDGVRRIRGKLIPIC